MQKDKKGQELTLDLSHYVAHDIQNLLLITDVFMVKKQRKRLTLLKETIPLKSCVSLPLYHCPTLGTAICCLFCLKNEGYSFQ